MFSKSKLCFSNSIPNFIILNVPNCLYLNNSDCIISFGSYFNSFMIFFNSFEIFNIIRSFVNSFRNFISTNIPLSINLRLYDVNYLLLCKDKNLNISLLLDEICMSRTYLMNSFQIVVLKDLSWTFLTFWRHKDLIFTLRFQAISLFYLFSPCLDLFNQLGWFTEFKTQF